MMLLEVLEDPKYLSNVNSAILDFRILSAKNAIFGLSRNTSFGKKQTVEMKLRGFRGSEIPFKCKQCHFRFN